MHDYQLDNWYKTSLKSYKEERGAQLSLAKFLAKIAKALVIVGLLIAAVAFVPSIIYSINPDATKRISELIKTTAQEEVPVPIAEEPSYQPAFNPNLPEQNLLIIPSLNIETQIHEADFSNYEEALKKGVWRIPDFGTPFGRSRSTILAAHRYGYLRWSISYRLKNSFYNLPKVKTGETVEIVWKQRRYIYEIYKEEEGEAISDYTADLILYTCESLNSPVRIFRYARLLEI